jgi:hypothetical protein
LKSAFLVQTKLPSRSGLVKKRLKLSYLKVIN